MIKRHKHGAMKLYSLIKKTCNGSTTVLADDALCSCLFLRGDEYDSLSKHTEASEQRRNVMQEAGASFANDKMLVGYVAELVIRDQQQSSILPEIKDLERNKYR